VLKGRDLHEQLSRGQASGPSEVDITQSESTDAILWWSKKLSEGITVL